MHVLTNFQRKIQQILRMISILRPFAFLSTHPVLQEEVDQEEVFHKIVKEGWNSKHHHLKMDMN